MSATKVIRDEAGEMQRLDYAEFRVRGGRSSMMNSPDELVLVFEFEEDGRAAEDVFWLERVAGTDRCVPNLWEWNERIWADAP